MAKNAIGYIYYILNPVTSHIKIGYSASPEKRLQALQTSNSVKLEMLYFREGTIEEEINIHKQFFGLNVIGEWFLYNDIIDAWIQDEFDRFGVNDEIMCVSESALLMEDKDKPLKYFTWLTDDEYIFCFGEHHGELLSEVIIHYPEYVDSLLTDESFPVCEKQMITFCLWRSNRGKIKGKI